MLGGGRFKRVSGAVVIFGFLEKMVAEGEAVELLFGGEFPRRNGFERAESGLAGAGPALVI